MQPKGVAFFASSLDGFISGENGAMEWLTDRPLADTDYGYLALMQRVGAVAMGRKTFEFVLSQAPDWPYQAPVIVATSRPLSVRPDRVVEKAGAPESIFTAAAEAAHGKLVLVEGGHVVGQALQTGFLAEFTVSWIPVLLGAGSRAFGDFKAPSTFKLRETHQYPDGVVQARYDAF